MPNRSVSRTARAIFKRALADSATLLKIKDSEGTVAFFRRGNCDRCSVLRDNLARHVGEYLATVDTNLQAVYLFDPDAACDVYEDFHTDSTPWCSLNLIAWTRTSKSQSTHALEILREPLTKACAEVLCPKATALCFALNMTVVNNAEVKARKGYAALIHSFRTHPTQVWRRPQACRAWASKRVEPA